MSLAESPVAPSCAAGIPSPEWEPGAAWRESWNTITRPRTRWLAHIPIPVKLLMLFLIRSGCREHYRLEPPNLVCCRPPHRDSVHQPTPIPLILRFSTIFPFDLPTHSVFLSFGGRFHTRSTHPVSPHEVEKSQFIRPSTCPATGPRPCICTSASALALLRRFHSGTNVQITTLCTQRHTMLVIHTMHSRTLAPTSLQTAVKTWDFSITPIQSCTSRQPAVDSSGIPSRPPLEVHGADSWAFSLLSTN